MSELAPEVDGLAQFRHRIDLVTYFRRGMTGLAEGLLGMFSLPLEVILRHQLGRRYYSLPFVVLACWLPCLLHDLYIFLFGMIQAVPTIHFRSPYFGPSGTLDTFYVLAFWIAVLQKGVTLRMAAVRSEPVTTYAGKSLPPLQIMTTALLKALPGNQAYLGEEVTKRFAEPLTAYLVSLLVGLYWDPLLGWWLWFGAVALFLRAQLAFGLLREQALDQFDALKIAQVLHTDLKRRSDGIGSQEGVFAYTHEVPAAAETQDPKPAVTRSPEPTAEPRLTAAQLLAQRRKATA